MNQPTTCLCSYRHAGRIEHMGHAFRGERPGLFANSTFELAGLALFKNCSVSIVLTDIVWGTVLTGGTAAVALWPARVVLKIG